MDEPTSKKLRVDEKTYSEAADASSDDGQEELPIEAEDPLTLLARVRRDHLRQFGEANDVVVGGGPGDLALNISMVRALIATNQEIWKRCCSTNGGIQRDPDGKVFFTRLIYRHVAVNTVARFTGSSTSKTTNDAIFKGVVKFERITAEIVGIPTTIPSELSSIIAQPIDETSGVPDYDRCFETALLLHDDVLVPFLVTLKTHLECVQVAIGMVDEWLAETDLCTSFLNETFYTKLPDLAKVGCQNTCMKTHDHSEICMICGEEYSNHQKREHEFYDEWRHRRRTSTLHYCRSNKLASYHSYTPIELKLVKDTGEHKESFDVCKEAGRKKLKKFLDFLS